MFNRSRRKPTTSRAVDNSDNATQKDVSALIVQSGEEESDGNKVKYPKPKIMLIDLADVDLDVLLNRGHNIRMGSFGSPYKVNKSRSSLPVIPNANLPNHSEQEIVIIDLEMPSEIKLPDDLSEYNDDNHFYADCSDGIIDARLPAMYACQRDFDRIYHHGGLFVVFAQPRKHYNLRWGNSQGSQHTVDNWSFLSVLGPEYIQLERANGVEINFPDIDYGLLKFIQKYSQGCAYNATITATYRLGDNNWIPLMNDKYGRCVGGMIWNQESKEKVLILPPIKRNTDSILALVEKVLPEIANHLFPYIEGYNWIHRDEYELPGILKLRKEKQIIHERAKTTMKELDRQIEDERKRLGFLHGLLVHTGAELVKNVENSFQMLGFEKIVDVDESLSHDGNGSAKQEDLQILDRTPALLVEVKGIGSNPRESDLFQVVKYVNRRMREWKRTDICGMTIINHQRKLPANDRDNANVFTKTQIGDAVQNNCSLMTTYDLFLIIMGMIKWSWNSKSLHDMFYNGGRVQGPPAFYKRIGTIKHYYDDLNVLSIMVENRNLFLGQKIGYVTDFGYFEEIVKSLQQERNEVEQGTVGQLIGMKSIYGKRIAKEGATIYEVVN